MLKRKEIIFDKYNKENKAPRSLEKKTNVRAKRIVKVLIFLDRIIWGGLCNIFVIINYLFKIALLSKITKKWKGKFQIIA